MHVNSYSVGGSYKEIQGLCSKYLKTAAKVGSFLLQNIPWAGDADGATPDIQVLCNLAGKILSDIKETELGEVKVMLKLEYFFVQLFLPGKQFSLDEFVPIGNFSILQPDAISMLPPEFTTPQVQEAILKEPSRRTKGLGDIKEGHGLESYYCASITSLNRMLLQNRIKVDTKNLLQPTKTGEPFAAVRKEISGEFSCALMLKGSFLQIQMAADVNNFPGLPFTATSTAIVSTVSFCCCVFISCTLFRMKTLMKRPYGYQANALRRKPTIWWKDLQSISRLQRHLGRLK